MKITKNSFEYIQNMSDDDLTKSNAILNKLLHTARSSGDETAATAVEIELCYVFREQEVREKRKIAHESYLKKLS